MTKPTKWPVRPAKTQISLVILPVWSEFLLSTQWVTKGPRFLHADSEDPDQIGRMPRLIWVFAGHTADFGGFVVLRLKYGQQEQVTAGNHNRSTALERSVLQYFGA